jgi:hypothetical protein
MIAYAFIGADGIPTGGGIRPTLPEGAVALAPPLTTADLPRLRWTGSDWAWREAWIAPAPTAEERAVEAAARLASARAAALARVTQAVDALRRRVYTDIAGQDALYLEKRAEAVAYVRQTEMAGEPKDLDDYPLLANEVGVTAPTPWQLAQIWLHRSDQFKALGIATERARMIAATAITQAEGLAAIEAAEAAFLTDLSTLSP